VIGNVPQDRDKLLVTGVPPVTEPPMTPDREPVAETETAPVFVDASGGRARLGRRLGLLAGALLVVFLGSLGLGMTTGADVPLTPWTRPSPEPSVKLSRPNVPPKGRTSRAPAAAPGPTGPTGQAGGPAPSVAPRPSSTPGQAAATSTDRPGKSQASPPAWGRTKKNR
jgi:hypothetical protein